jgi:hypothetical protein
MKPIPFSNLAIRIPYNTKYYLLLRFMPVFLILSGFHSAQARIDQPLIDSFYIELYNYHFLSAKSHLQEIKKTEDDQGIVDLMEITYQWWMIISGESDPLDIEPLIKKIDKSIQSIVKKKRAQELSQNELLQLIAMYSYKSRVYNLRENRLSSFTAFSNSLDYFEQVLPCEHSDCDMYNFIAGMYYSLGGFMKEEHPSLFFLAFDNRYADREKGFQLLQQGTRSKNQQVRIESIYFLMKLYLEVQEDPDRASVYSGQLVKLFPENLVFRFINILTLRGKGDFESAENEIARLLDKADKNRQLTEKQRSHFREEIDQLNP